jgi:hypothetical protein
VILRDTDRYRVILVISQLVDKEDEEKGKPTPLGKGNAEEDEEDDEKGGEEDDEKGGEEEEVPARASPRAKPVEKPAKKQKLGKEKATATKPPGCYFDGLEDFKCGLADVDGGLRECKGLGGMIFADIA